MVATIFSTEQARDAAQRRLPRIFFDFIDGAAGAERLCQLNRTSLAQIQLLPRVLVNVNQRSLSKTLLGRAWGLPFGIAPMGMCDLAWPGTDAMLAAAARRYDIPLCLSTAASSSIEATRLRAGDNAWFQLYVGQSEQQAMDFVQRADDAGYPVLLFTVDVPQVAPRRRDLRNGFSAPLKIGPRQFWDLACHPRWSLQTLLAGAPRTANYPLSGSGAFARGEGRGCVDWQFLQRLRERWPRTLIVKGVLSAEDAVMIRDAGADAIYVSNHGGRQLDSGPPAIDSLPLVRAAVGADYPLLFDSGVSSGEDIVKALALGADFVLLGRAFLYAAGAAGERGLAQLIDALSHEVSVTLAQIGRPDIETVDASVLIAPRPGLTTG